jgi:hypothetical protein
MVDSTYGAGFYGEAVYGGVEEEEPPPIPPEDYNPPFEPLVWDKIGERIYQTGIDRGVLYLNDGTVVAWNGLINVEESTDRELKSSYLDGVKYLEGLSPGTFLGKLTAFTYPDEFDSVNGLVEVAPGLTYYDQPSKSFNLCYRTKIGNDLEGPDYGYKIHILYNIIANPDNYSFDTLDDSAIKPVEFSWSLTGTPPQISKFRPTVHISIDSTKVDSNVMQILEDILYGTEINSPNLPSIQEVAEIMGYVGALIIVDNGDGSWSAIDTSNAYITMLDETTFQIDNADADYLDTEMYQISSTNVSG